MPETVEAYAARIKSIPDTPGVQQAAQNLRQEIHCLKVWYDYWDPSNPGWLITFTIRDPAEKEKGLRMPDAVDAKCQAACRRVLKKEISDLDAKFEWITDYIESLSPR